MKWNVEIWKILPGIVKRKVCLTPASISWVVEAFNGNVLKVKHMVAHAALSVNEVYFVLTC